MYDKNKWKCKIMFMRDSVKNSVADKTNSNYMDEVLFITLSFLKIEISGFSERLEIWSFKIFR